jgi:putative transposase
VIAGETVMATKRCIHGQLRLRPDPEAVQTYLYVLGYAQQKYDISLHDFMVLSNHDHPVYTDEEAKGPLFIQMLHSLVARALNCKWGEWDSFWSGQRYGKLRLLETEDVEARCIYALLNPVAAGLVRYAWDWTGVTSWNMEYGVPITVKKPDFFFSKKMPDEVKVVITRPEGLHPGMSDRDARGELRRVAKAKQGDLIAEFKRKGGTYMGMKRVLRQPRNTIPNSSLQRRGIRPHIACRSKWARIEALQNLKGFWAAHEAARLDHHAGNDAVFPHGTYLMRVRCNCKVRPPP